MSPSFMPRLVNGRFGDPAVFVEVAQERDALLLDLGDVASLGVRDLLRVRTVAVSHMHIDHLFGFDALLRVNVGRDATIDLIGPDGLAACVGAKLAGYTWDLVERYATELTFLVHEVVASGRIVRTRFRFSRRFVAETEKVRELAAGEAIIKTSRWRLSTTILAHHGPCVAFAIEAPVKANVRSDRMAAAGLVAGPWLKVLKVAVLDEAPGETPVELPGGRTATLDNCRPLVSVERGQKIGYVTDVADTPDNRGAIADLCRDADVLFIEASFAAADRQRAADRAHLTTVAAGEIGRACGARRLEPFHFSPRYDRAEQMLLDEVFDAFAGRMA